MRTRAGFYPLIFFSFSLAVRRRRSFVRSSTDDDDDGAFGGRRGSEAPRGGASLRRGFVEGVPHKSTVCDSSFQTENPKPNAASDDEEAFSQNSRTLSVRMHRASTTTNDERKQRWMRK